ncbi:uncharacterized protein LOC132203430 [Neocloeon triangulifer]|uniref:uncharacterized protein LOC132203430 n=1 Tax=Neocloeon triangulifer TaxID=2078957 RepID=UPI00286F5492|nr:uncharacterized protein LOC132203430 [Neocloeon triangulifer]
MDPSLFSKDDGVLFVGEGNFSFALNFKKRHGKLRHVIATCFEEKDKILKGAEENVALLEEQGARVVFGVDATKLHTYNYLRLNEDYLSNCIIFNFPHIGGKMKIHRNRELLRNFFASVRKFLANSCQKLPTACTPRVIVNLCKGQGGTEADGSDQRVWGNSWQINEMAAASGFVLSQILPFNHDLCDGYSSVGFRSREQWFHTENALVHVFEPAPPPLLLPKVTEKESLVQLSTRYGNIQCDRTHLEVCAALSEVETNFFMSTDQKLTPQIYLYNKLVDLIKNSSRFGENFMVVHTNYLPYHCDLNLKRVACYLQNSVKYLRRSLADVMDFCKKDSFVTFGPVFKPLDELPFSESPAPYQIIIKHFEVDRVTGLITLWLTSLLGESSLDVEMDEDQWTVQYAGRDLAYKCHKNAVIVELDLLAKVFFKLASFRDLLNAKYAKSTFVPTSIFPRTHVLDICFILGEQFSEAKFNVVLWRALGRFVMKKELVNTYSPDGEEWTSHCYRVHYRSTKEALSRKAAIVMHQEFLPEVLLKTKIAQRVL